MSYFANNAGCVWPTPQDNIIDGIIRLIWHNEAIDTPSGSDPSRPVVPQNSMRPNTSVKAAS